MLLVKEIHIWMQMLGFDRNDPDRGAARFLERTGFTPKSICGLLFHPDFVHCHRGMEEEYVLFPDNCAYHGIPRNKERERQPWTNHDLSILIREMKKRGVEYRQTTNLEEALPELDILYMTRVQRERFFNEEDYARLKDTYILDLEKLETAKEDLTIMHPLPRVNEISVKVDDDPRACYFYQALCGKHIRMALILNLLGIK